MNQTNHAIRDAKSLGLPKMLILGIQHMFAMFGATILVPILVNSYFVDACGEGSTRGLTVSVTLFCAGVGTLLFHVCAKMKVPAFLGSSFAFLGGFATVAHLDSGIYAGMSANDKAAYACEGVVVAGLQKRFIFIDYQKDTNDCEVSSHSLVINGKLIEMTKIILSDFGILYDALSAKKAALPVKLLRRFKDELYSFALTQQPGPTMQVAALDDGRIDENMLALSIGLASTGVYGLARAVNSEQWYRNIILHDSMYSCDKLLEYVYPELAKQNSWKLPVWYYIANSDYKSSLAESKAPHSYNDIVSEDSIKRNRTAIAGRTAMEIWTQEKTNVFKAIRLLGFLPEDKIDVEQYQQILETIFKENANILSSSNTSDRSSLKRMIRIYDFLLYRQKKTP